MKFFIILILVSMATCQSPTTPGCEVNNPYIRTITISDARLQFQDVKEDLQRLASRLNVPVDLVNTGATSYPSDCNYLVGSGSPSGVYKIRPTECPDPISVYCDMDIDGGGWTVIQRREDSSVNFNRGWTDYQQGFGSRFTEYWIGNENLYWLTAQGKYELRVDLEDFTGEHKTAIYYSFRVGDSATNYQLQIANYDEELSSAGDALSYHDRAPFTTPDYDNDEATPGNCARHFRSGWWFANCYHANLNGVYRTNGEEESSYGIVWSEWRGLNISMKLTEMKIRPTTMSLK